ncbi:hypothetical protein PENSPDRAFT_655963 [Peniophora sp. CONT]|nr:hypothetical protein PENSPDRAFT_655963 [Peniophora sp. CONT]
MWRNTYVTREVRQGRDARNPPVRARVAVRREVPVQHSHLQQIEAAGSCEERVDDIKF